MKILLKSMLLCLATACSIAPQSPSKALDAKSGGAESALEMTKKIAGVYIGKWASYGLSEDGSIVVTQSWTDVLTAKDPVEEEGRAYLTGTDEMKFDAGFNYTSVFKEGYLKNPDGSVGSHFVSYGDDLTKYIQLDGSTSTYTKVLTKEELDRLGFSEKHVLSASSTTVKTETLDPNGIEEHFVSTLSTVQWQESATGAGEVKTLQFVSFKGSHKKQLAAP